MVDPPHPRSGHPLPRRRVPSRRSKARRVVQRPDGRVQWLPRAGTELDASAGAAPPPARMAVPTLLPLAPLGGARLTGKEARPPDTAPALPRRVVHAPLTVPLNESRGAPDLAPRQSPRLCPRHSALTPLPRALQRSHAPRRPAGAPRPPGLDSALAWPEPGPAPRTRRLHLPRPRGLQSGSVQPPPRGPQGSSRDLPIPSAWQGTPPHHHPRRQGV